MPESWDALLEADPVLLPRSADAAISGSLAGARNRGPMVPLEEIARLRVGQWVPGMPMPESASRARATALAAGRITSNAALLGLILLILAIPISIGVNKLGLLNVKGQQGVSAKTLVPTPPLPDGFAGFQTTEYSLAYPSVWQQTRTTFTLSNGDVLHLVRFTDPTTGSETSLTVATITAYPADTLSTQIDPIAHQLHTETPLHPTSPEERITYHGVVWIERDYEQTLVRGNTAIPMTIRVLAADSGATSYFIIVATPTSDLDKTNKATFVPVLNSLRFPQISTGG